MYGINKFIFLSINIKVLHKKLQKIALNFIII